MSPVAPDRREWGLVLTATLLLTIWWAAPWLPYAAGGLPDPARSGQIADAADARLVVWVLAWQAHAFWTAPLAFFDANVFYPAGHMLTGSDTFVTAALLASPIYWLTHNALLAANSIGIVSYGLCFLLTYAAVRRTGAGGLPSALAGVAVALGPFRVPADLHALQYPAWILPLVLLAFLRAQEGKRLWGSVVVAITLGLFSSYYMAAMVLLVVGVEIVVRGGSQGWQSAFRPALAALPGLALLAAFSIPWAMRSGEVGPTFEQTQASFAVVANLIVPNYFDPSNPMVGVGWVVAVLALLGLLQPLLVWELPHRDWSRWVLLLLASLAFALGPSISLGDARLTLPFGYLLDTPLRTLRAFPRFFILSQFALAGLAAVGMGLILRLFQGWGGVRMARVAATLLILGALFPRSVSLWQTKFSRLPVGAAAPEVYDVLARQEPGALLEVPGPWSPMALRRKLVQADFMVQSTWHWRPLVGGHVGYPPWWSDWLRREIYLIPDDPGALQAVVNATGLRWVLVHRDHLKKMEWERWRRADKESSGLELIEETPMHLLFRVGLEPILPWRFALRSGVPRDGETILGTSRRLILPDEAHGRIERVDAAETVAAGTALSLRLRVHNRSDRDWPALAPRREPQRGLVVFELTWEDAETGSPVSIQEVPLLRDLLAGEAQQNWIETEVPAGPGDYVLRVGLRQVGGSSFEKVPPLPIPIHVYDLVSNTRG